MKEEEKEHNSIGGGVLVMNMEKEKEEKEEKEEEEKEEKEAGAAFTELLLQPPETELENQRQI